MSLEVIIRNHEGEMFLPIVCDGVTIESAESSTPGMMVFDIINDGNISFLEGAQVFAINDKKGIFAGIVFKKKRTVGGDKITVTAYDQLRYLKNRHTYKYGRITLTTLVNAIARDFNLTVGSLENTGVALTETLCENKSLFDIIGDAVEDTVENGGERFILYDDYGRLYLKSRTSMLTNYYVDEETCIDPSYETSIDQSYNKVTVTDDTMAYSWSDLNRIAEWGLLEHSEKLGENENGKSKALQLLLEYRNKQRTLEIPKAVGDDSVRGGSVIWCKLNLGDVIVDQKFVVESVKHTYSADEHWMQLHLTGGEFV